MKKNLNIVMGDKPLVLDRESMIDVKDSNPLTSNKPIFCSSTWQ